MAMNLPCLMGSHSQLPSSHLSIHRVPAKLAYRVMLHGEYSCRLQLLFAYWIVTDQASLRQHWSDQWTLAAFVPSCLFMLISYILRYRLQVPSPEPCPASRLSLTVRQGSEIFVQYYLLLFVCLHHAAWAAFWGLLISCSIFAGSYFVPVLRMA